VKAPEKAKRKLTALRIDEGSAVDSPANQHAKIVLFKRDTRESAASAARAEEQPKEKDMKDTDVKKARTAEEIMAAMPPEDKAVMEEAVKAAIAAAVEQAKAAPEAKAEMAKSLEAVEKAAKAQIETLQKQLGDLVTERKREQAIAKARSFGVAGANVEEMADMLLAVDGNEKAAKAIEGIIKAAKAAQDAAGLTNPIGKSGNDAPPAFEQIKALAVELRKSNTNMTEAQAIDAVAHARPDLASQCA